jgi:intracellular sulfur oxidation DsrE/DsrF family protein
MGTNLWCVIFVNGGVKLTISESPVLEQLQVLENMGVSILVCGACLEYFGLTDKKAVGATTNMLDIVTSLQLADKVLRV